MSQAAISHCRIATLPQARISRRRSSVFSGQGKFTTFFCTASAVSTVVISPRRRLASIAARPEVKLMFTGILPASSTARFATQHPPLGGRTMPTRRSGMRAAIRRDSAAATARSLPALITERSPVQSMICVSHGRRASERTQARPRCPCNSGRSLKASSPRSNNALRTLKVSTLSPGIGHPMLTVTGQGNRW